MKRKPRLLYLVTEDWYFCSHRLELAIAAREAGFDVTVATRVSQHAGRIRGEGINLVPLSWSRRSTHPVQELAALREVIAVYRSLRPDVVHHVALKPVLYGSLAARLTKVPQVINAIAGLGYVFASHDVKAGLLRPFLRAAFRLLLDQKNARLIVQNQDDLAQFTNERIVDTARMFLIRGSGVNLDQFKLVSEPKGIPLVVLPARMLRDKGVEEFVAAARTLKEAGVGARFALVGSPDSENPACIANEQIAAWQSENIVEYWGWRDDMAAVFQQAHVVCLPSYREGLPKALIEAAACGRPIVTTDVPGCREVVREGDNGFLVPPRDSALLAVAINRLLADPALRQSMGKRGRERAQLEFALDKVIAETLALYRGSAKHPQVRVEAGRGNVLMHNPSVPNSCRERYAEFILACRVAQPSSYSLTPGAPQTPFALCFAVFGLRLLRETLFLENHRAEYSKLIRENLASYCIERNKIGDLSHDKPYLQLLTFSLSALKVLDTLAEDPLEEFVLPLLPNDIERKLMQVSALSGAPRSGNTAMFWAILLIHAKEYLERDTQAALDTWVHCHLARMNTRGFWGGTRGMTHLQFQNGYHQYEIFEYLGVRNPKLNQAISSVTGLADKQGHFAPYPGGGGCYDYDAVHILTAGPNSVDTGVHDVLRRTFASLLGEHNADGGFAESLRIRPRSFANLAQAARHVLGARGPARWERLRYCATLLRPKHDLIQTHWSSIGRGWGQSNLWDSWFRMLTLARIEVFFNPAAASQWGFVDYPGIGYHPSCRHAAN